MSSSEILGRSWSNSSDAIREIDELDIYWRIARLSLADCRGVSFCETLSSFSFVSSDKSVPVGNNKFVELELICLGKRSTESVGCNRFSDLASVDSGESTLASSFSLIS